MARSDRYTSRDGEVDLLRLGQEYGVQLRWDSEAETVKASSLVHWLRKCGVLLAIGECSCCKCCNVLVPGTSDERMDRAMHDGIALLAAEKLQEVA